MPLTIPTEIERSVRLLAAATDRDPQDLLLALLGAAVDEALMLAEVDTGLGELDRGESVPHAQAMAVLEGILAQHSTR